MTEFRMLREAEITGGLFAHFCRHQAVVKCWRKDGDSWVIKDDPFIDDWSEADYRFLVKCLKNTVHTGGVVYGAFIEGLLKGFASVEGARFGTTAVYLDLSSLHVSEELRGHGLGTQLFSLAAAWAKEKGAEKLYISSHSAAETQAFYRGVGCVDAVEINRRHAEQEPFDCQLEYVL